MSNYRYFYAQNNSNNNVGNAGMNPETGITTPVGEIPPEATPPVNELPSEAGITLPIGEVPPEAGIITPTGEMPPDMGITNPVGQLPPDVAITTPIGELPEWGYPPSGEFPPMYPPNYIAFFLQRCMNGLVYLRTTSGEDYWFYPTDMARGNVSGYRWNWQAGWFPYELPIATIRNIYCYSE